MRVCTGAMPVPAWTRTTSNNFVSAAASQLTWSPLVLASRPQHGMAGGLELDMSMASPVTSHSLPCSRAFIYSSKSVLLLSSLGATSRLFFLEGGQLQRPSKTPLPVVRFTKTPPGAALTGPLPPPEPPLACLCRPLLFPLPPGPSLLTSFATSAQDTLATLAESRRLLSVLCFFPFLTRLILGPCSPVGTAFVHPSSFCFTLAALDQRSLCTRQNDVTQSSPSRNASLTLSVEYRFHEG